MSWRAFIHHADAVVRNEFTACLVPYSSTYIQAMLAVTISAGLVADGRFVKERLMSINPLDVSLRVAGNAEGMNAVSRKHNIGRYQSVLISAVPIRNPMASLTADAGGLMFKR